MGRYYNFKYRGAPQCANGAADTGRVHAEGWNHGFYITWRRGAFPQVSTLPAYKPGTKDPAIEVVSGSNWHMYGAAEVYKSMEFPIGLVRLRYPNSWFGTAAVSGSPGQGQSQ